jgi:small subunit ribosomal protein S6e
MVELQSEEKLSQIIDKRIGEEIDGELISDVFAGYRFKITGGFDKDGFAMKNGILTQGRKRIMLTKGNSLFRFRKGYHRTGIRKRKLVRGCIISNDIKNLHLKIVKKGPKPIEGLTEEKDAQPKRLGPKRATRILKAFGMTEIYKQKKADKNERKTLAALITQFAPKRTVKTKNGKEYVKRPKVQRLITPDRLRRKRLLKKFHEQRREKAKKDKEAYQELVKKLKGKKEKKDKKDDKKDKKEKKAEKK